MKKSQELFMLMSVLAFLIAGVFTVQAEKDVPDRVIGAGANWGNGKVYFFKGDKYVRYSAKPDMAEDLMGDRADPGYPKTIDKETWPGLNWTDIDAVVFMGNGKVCFFKGKEYIQYDIDADRADPWYPKPISDQTWPGMIWTDGIDDVVNWGNGKAYFFKGNEDIRYDIKDDMADPGYPKRVNRQTWPGLVNW